jgi:hypothetical protein
LYVSLVLRVWRRQGRVEGRENLEVAGVEEKVGSDGEGIAEPGVVHCLKRWLGFCGSW